MPKMHQAPVAVPCANGFNGSSPEIFRWFVLQLGTTKFLQMMFENLTCIAGNCSDALWVRQLTSIGTSHGIQYAMHGTKGLINNWNTMVSKCGQANICPNIGNLQITLLIVAVLDDNRWVKRMLHWNPGGGRPGRSLSQGHTPIQNFCRWHHLGNWRVIARSTDLWFQYYADFMSFPQRWWSFVACTWSVLTFHFRCPKWAAARHTGSKSKKLNGMLLYPRTNGMSSYPEIEPCRANILNHSGRIGCQWSRQVTFALSTCMPWYGSPFRAQGVRPNKHIANA